MVLMQTASAIELNLLFRKEKNFFVKRFFDMVFSIVGLFIMLPVLLVLMFLFWLQDFHSPFYVAPRVGRNGRIFNMVKLRSMVVHADKIGVNSTAVGDKRITRIGHLIRKYKMDEVSQLWNVFRGQMSIVGPRPQVPRDVALYTRKERHMLDVRPGITDLASIVFSDEGEILKGSEDPDLKYNQVIRPWKSRLGLLYVQKNNFFLDLQIIMLTVTAILSRSRALFGVQKILKQLGTDEMLLKVARRQESLKPYPPPGSQIVEIRRG
jgi:lipopolysaccharide/colanic/teichoic acid biosynthesis glycosyltransferase